jgi:hypothetical protein
MVDLRSTTDIDQPTAEQEILTMSPTSIPTNRTRTRTSLLVALAGAILALLAFGPAPQASAHHSGVIGTPGPYTINSTPNTGTQIMIRGNLTPTGFSFYTGGVTVARSTASTNPQTITARYRMEYWSEALNTWVPLDEYDVSTDVSGFVPGHYVDYPTAALPSHSFYPALQARGTIYRVMYTVDWRDKVTGADLGYRDVYPDVENNLCALNPGQCQAYTEGILVDQ